MSEFMPDTGPGDSAKSAVRAAVPVVLLLVVIVWLFSIIGDYRAATAGDAVGGASAEETGSVEATQVPGAAEESADEQGTDGGEVEVETTPATDTQHVVVLIAGLNYREEPKADSEVMRTLPEGTKLVLLGQQNGWYQVRDEDGVVGWVSSSSQYVELVEE